MLPLTACISYFKTWREQVKASLSPRTSLHNDAAVDRQAEPVSSQRPHVGLPHDVLLHVIAHCARQTLIAWVSTSKLLNVAAEARLVAHMDGTSFALISAWIRHNRQVQQTTFRRSSSQAAMDAPIAESEIAFFRRSARFVKHITAISTGMVEMARMLRLIGPQHFTALHSLSLPMESPFSLELQAYTVPRLVRVSSLFEAVPVLRLEVLARWDDRSVPSVGMSVATWYRGQPAEIHLSFPWAYHVDMPSSDAYVLHLLGPQPNLEHLVLVLAKNLTLYDPPHCREYSSRLGRFLRPLLFAPRKEIQQQHAATGDWLPMLRRISIGVPVQKGQANPSEMSSALSMFQSDMMALLEEARDAAVLSGAEMFIDITVQQIDVASSKPFYPAWAGA